MHRHGRSVRQIVLGAIALQWLVAGSGAMASTAPYPQSQLIVAMSWDFPTSSLRKAQGSDLWPNAWAADGSLYASWGDGGGFDGDSNNIGRVSLGFAQINGVPQLGAPTSYAGLNIWGAAPAYARHQASFGGKIEDLLAVNGVLYGYGGLWTKANCNCADPTQKWGENLGQHTAVWSTDLGASWHVAPWTSQAGPGISLQYGQDYRGAADPAHVYFYYQRDINSDAGHLYLRRVAISDLTGDPSAGGHFQYLCGTAAGSSQWCSAEALAEPIFFDPAVPSGTYTVSNAIYDAALGRYVLTMFHGDATGQLGFFEAEQPWGPWATIAYYDDWGGLNEAAGEGNGLMFPTKWVSPDGATLWAVYSGVTNGYDSFNLARAVLSLSSGSTPTGTQVGYWPFNEDQGTVAHDESGSGQNAKLAGAVHWSAGEAGAALSFDGGTSEVVAPGSGALANLYRHGLTVSAWIKPRALGGSGRIADKDGNQYGWFLKVDGDTVQFAGDQFNTAPVIRTGSRPLTSEVWQHIAVTWDGSIHGAHVHLYLDGAPIDGNYSDGSGSPGDDSSVPLTIGNRAADLARGFDGIIDEVRIYDRELTSAQIHALWAGQ